MSIKIDFIKGHMGGDGIILLYGDQIPKGREIEVALSALDPPNVRGHEAGLLYKGKAGITLKVKIIGALSKHFISMCGGLTQVLCKALIETDLSEYLDLEPGGPVMKIALETDVGSIPLEIENSHSRVERVLTGMKPFVDECYRLGIQPIKVANVNAMRIGKFLVVKGDEIRREYPNFRSADMNGTTLQVLRRIQEAFDSQGYLKQKNADFALYDLNPEKPDNNGRVIFPHGPSSGYIDSTCGTGTVAVGIAMVESGEIGSDTNEIELFFESGGCSSSIGGPDLTRLKLKIRNGNVVGAVFSHSLVEILATGKLWI